MKIHLFGKDSQMHVDITPGEDTSVVFEFENEDERDTHARNLGDMAPDHLLYGIFGDKIHPEDAEEILENLKAGTR